MTAVAERAVSFPCAEAELVGILHLPAAAARRGVLIVVGGPQYRAGSHRQFLLIARRLAEQGYPVLRFDHRGIGDSDGPYLGFEALDADISRRSEEHTSELQSLMRISYAVFCLKQKKYKS